MGTGARCLPDVADLVSSCSGPFDVPALTVQDDNMFRKATAVRGWQQASHPFRISSEMGLEKGLQFGDKLLQFRETFRGRLQALLLPDKPGLPSFSDAHG